MDEKGEKVETWRMTKEQLAFQRAWKKHKAVEKVLRALTEAQQNKMTTLRELWEGLSMSYDNLTRNAPTEVLRELEGMDFRNEEQAKEMAPQSVPMIQY